MSRISTRVCVLIQRYHVATSRYLSLGFPLALISSHLPVVAKFTSLFLFITRQNDGNWLHIMYQISRFHGGLSHSFLCPFIVVFAFSFENIFPLAVKSDFFDIIIFLSLFSYCPCLTYIQQFLCYIALSNYFYPYSLWLVGRPHCKHWKGLFLSWRFLF